MENVAPKIHNLVSQKPRPATLKARFYAFVIDLVFILVISRTFLFGFVSFVEHFVLEFNGPIKSRVMSIDPLIFMATFWPYFFLSLYLGEGATPGKFTMGLRVHSTHKKDTHLSFTEAFSRTMAYFFCYFSGGFLLAIPYLNRQRKGLPDWLSHTHVVSLEELRARKELESTPVVLSFKKWEPFPEDPVSKKLSQEQIKKVA